MRHALILAAVLALALSGCIQVDADGQAGTGSNPVAPLPPDAYPTPTPTPTPVYVSALAYEPPDAPSEALVTLAGGTGPYNCTAGGRTFVGSPTVTINLDAGTWTVTCSDSRGASVSFSIVLAQ